MKFLHAWDFAAQRTEAWRVATHVGAALTERLAGGPAHSARLAGRRCQHQPDGTLATPPLQLRGWPWQVCAGYTRLSHWMADPRVIRMQPDDFSCRNCSPDSPLASFESSWPRSGFEPMGGAASAWQQNSSMQRQSAPSGSEAQLHSKPAAPAADCSHEPRQPGGSPDTASPMQPDDDTNAGPPTPLGRCVHMHHACPWAHAGLETPHTAHQVLPWRCLCMSTWQSPS